MIWTPTREFIEGTNVWRFMQRLGFRRPRGVSAFLARRSRALLGRDDARNAASSGSTPYEQVMDVSPRAGVDAVVHGRPAEHRAQLPGPLGRQRSRGLHLGGRERRDAHRHLPRTPRGSQSRGQRAAGARPGSGRPRRALPADGPGDPADSLRLLQGGAHGGPDLRRLRRGGDRHAAGGFRCARAVHRGPPGAARQAASAGGEDAGVRRHRRSCWRRRWERIPGAAAAEFATRSLDSEARAFILYTSGTTGKPKGTVHTHAGCLAQMGKEIWLGFDHRDDDRFFWLSDIGWMMGPWTILGNHLFGGTIFLYDGAPDFPGPDAPLGDDRAAPASPPSASRRPRSGC